MTTDSAPRHLPRHRRSTAQTTASVRRPPIALALVISATLGACAVGPNYERPEVPLPDQWSAVVSGDMASAARAARWWEHFDDPLLTALVQEAAAQNLSLQGIGLRIIAARATLRINAGNRFPQLQQLEGEALRTGISDNGANVLPGIDDAYWEAAIGAELSWEFDFWGKFRRNIEASQADLYEVVASYDAALVELISETARTYLLVRTLQQLLEVTRTNVALQQRSLEISEVLARNERTTDLDVEQARTLLESTRSDIPQLEASLIQARNALSFLLGQAPGALAKRLGTGPIPAPPESIALGLPADLLRQRPDVLEAELAAAAQAARVGVAVADRFPAFSLLGFVGLRAGDTSGTSVGDLLEGDSIESAAGPTFSVPVFNYGRLKNAVLVEDALLQGALVSYRETVLNAAREVEDAIVGYLKQGESLLALTRSANAAERAVELALLQYREGIATYQRVIDTQRELNTQQQLAVQSRGDVVDELVLLYKALGGGWEIRQGQAVVDEQYLQQMRARVSWGDRLDDTSMPATAVTPPAPASEQPAFGPLDR